MLDLAKRLQEYYDDIHPVGSVSVGISEDSLIVYEYHKISRDLPDWIEVPVKFQRMNRIRPSRRMELFS